jgi:hypothetical protein
LESFTEDMDLIEKRDKHIIWKIKGIAASTTYRLFTKYGNPLLADKPYEDFAKYFGPVCGVALLESHLALVFKRKTVFVGTKALNFALKYINASINLDITMEKLKPFIENLLYETLIPIILITHKDVTLYKDEPIEYIRK